MNKKLAVISILSLLLTTGCFKQKEQNLDVSEFNVKAQQQAIKKNDEKAVKTDETTKENNYAIIEKKKEIRPNNEQISSKNEEPKYNEVKHKEAKYKEKPQLVEEKVSEVSQILDENFSDDTKLKHTSSAVDDLKYKKLRGEIEDVILDTQALDEEDNTRYSWWLRLNNNHEVSGIDPYAEKLIDDYQIVYAGDTTQKKVYLTFDEGYENGYTPKILDTLKENNVKGIFFITGSYLKRNPGLVKRMLDEGHKVGSHSVNHPSFPEIASKSYEKLEKEMLDLEKDFYNEFGIGFSYIRPPRGEYSKRTLMAANQLGYKNVFWSYAYKDYDVNDQKGTNYAYNRVMDHLHNGMVVLLHAVSKDNANALDKIIKDIKAQGYEICPFEF